ncbi:MAG: hypothetical protein HQL71_06350 [Magnetococcales bacterium]|nr:hypothetical protein [Magnetococcales bacterium]
MQDSSTSSALLKTLKAITIHSATSYTIAGGQTQSLEEEPNKSVNENSQLITSLTNSLYARCYITPFSLAHNKNQSYDLEDPFFTTRLSKANQGRDRWDNNWQIYEITKEGRILAQKGECSRSALPGTYQVAQGKPKKGDSVSLAVSTNENSLTKGFYYMNGETLSDQFDEYDLLRFYFNIKAEGAAPLVEYLSRELNLRHTPFSFKCLNNLSNYNRLDSAVLYIAKRYYRVVISILTELPKEITKNLNPQTSLFTKPLLPGISLAEDPGNGESFGMHRCKIVAQGVVKTWKNGSQSPKDRLETINDIFTQKGLSLEHSYLKAGSTDIFTLPHSTGVIL